MINIIIKNVIPPNVPSSRKIGTIQQQNGLKYLANDKYEKQ